VVKEIGLLVQFAGNKARQQEVKVTRFLSDALPLAEGETGVPDEGWPPVTIWKGQIASRD